MPLIAASTCSHMPSRVAIVGDRRRSDRTPSSWSCRAREQTQNGDQPGVAIGRRPTAPARRAASRTARRAARRAADRCRCRRCAVPSRCCEWACDVAYATRREVSPSVLTAPSVMRHRAARIEASVASLAEPWITPPPVVAGRAEVVGQAQQFVHPVDHQRLDLGARRAGDPAHALDAETGCQQIARGSPGTTSWRGSTRRSWGAANGSSPGTTTRSVSAITASNPSGVVGGCSSSWARTSPG